MGLTLSDIKPEPAEFVLSKTGKTYHLRAVTLADHVWVNEKHKGKLEALGRNEVDLMFIAQFVYRLLENKEKADFPAETIQDFDDNGVPFDRLKSGPEKFLEALNWGLDLPVVTQALMKTIVGNQPMMDTKDEEALKKSV